MEKLGARIRNERKAKGLSLQELAKKCGVATMTLQRIETGKTSPSVALLSQIAHYLSQPVQFFIREESPKIRVVKGNEYRRIETDAMRLSMIAPIGFIEENVFVNAVEAKEGQFVESHTDDGYSFVYIIEGGIIFEHDGQKYELHAGDVLYYDASYTHSVTALENHKSVNIFFKGKK